MRESSRLHSAESEVETTAAVRWRYVAAAWAIVALICVLGLSVISLKPPLTSPNETVKAGVIIPRFNPVPMWRSPLDPEEEERASGQR